MEISRSIQVLSKAISAFMSGHSGESALLHRLPPEASNEVNSENKIESDIERLGFCVFSEDGSTLQPIDKTSTPIQHLRTIAGKLFAIDEYYQEVMDFLIPIIYTEVQANPEISYSCVERECILIYETFLYPYLRDSYRLALKQEHVLRGIPGYYIGKPVELREIEGILVELASTALWFSRTFAYPDLVYVYAHLLGGRLHRVYLFFLASIKIIREREKKSNGFSLCDVKGVLGAEKMGSLVRRSEELEGSVGGRFLSGGNSVGGSRRFLFLAGAGVLAAVCAGLLLYRERRK
ncbi:uncharacterized protein NEMAJ01_1817 [Nematocida major]|uniref:uncharacterized protein n=1 Tax=Nematocida major TaxID=1912982 RepID=UPI0020074D50|nr:uncharacterized protein NEMAJ01_1817 [Nematocida major]KAH9386921.1 hypothetical protein NEMAJ01_1817 [Nematocida major]